MHKKLLASISAAALLMLAIPTAAHADYVSPDDLMIGDDFGFYSQLTLDTEELSFNECSVVIPETGGTVGYRFDNDDRPTGGVEVASAIQSFSASLAQGEGDLWVLIDRRVGESGGIADISMQIPVGVHGFSSDSVVTLNDHGELGLPVDPTVQDVLDALEDNSDEYFIINLEFYSAAGAELQWLAFGSQTYWFGTNAEWFSVNPTCASVVPQPTPPRKIETAA